jgi:hypothetical protein
VAFVLFVVSLAEDVVWVRNMMLTIGGGIGRVDA